MATTHRAGPRRTTSASGGRITAAKAYANNEVAFVAWTLDAPIAGCVGFEITRIYEDGTEIVLPSWVPFTGQRNAQWLPQTTSVWPVQKLYWRDLTARKRRDATTRRPADVKIRYRIRPLVLARDGLDPVTQIPKKTYTGRTVPLSYAGPGAETNEVLITAKHGDVRAAFTNGILSAQWLVHALARLGQKPTPEVLRAHMQDPADPLRGYLTGDVLGLLKELLERAAGEKNARVHLALYELADPELIALLARHAARVRLILSNTSRASAGKDKGKWDTENLPSRRQFRKSKMELTDRLFNNGHIGHNKFAVLVGGDGTPRAVLTGSTNWTPTGLCGQSNNAMIVESPTLAARFLDYWQQLLDDTGSFETPRPVGSGSRNVQGPTLREENAKPVGPVAAGGRTRVTLWRAPNTKSATKKDEPPPDMAHLFSMMRKAEDAILFAAFLPSRSGKASIIEEAIQLGLKDPSLIVYGAISDPTAMPNYVAPPRASDGDGEGAAIEKVPPPAVYDRDNVHVVRAAALSKTDLIGRFEAELLKTGHAIIHDKVVVVDPLSDDGFVAMGSHNMGFKASYENDENLLIIRHNPSLVRAYAVHVMDLYEHYRFRAVVAERRVARSGRAANTRAAEKEAQFDGFLARNDAWLARAMGGEGGRLARYFTR